MLSLLKILRDLFPMTIGNLDRISPLFWCRALSTTDMPMRYGTMMSSTRWMIHPWLCNRRHAILRPRRSIILLYIGSPLHRADGEDDEKKRKVFVQS